MAAPLLWQHRGWGIHPGYGQQVLQPLRKRREMRTSIISLALFSQENK